MKRIIWVDDNSFIMEKIGSLFKKEGIEICLCNSLDDLLFLIINGSENNKKYDAIIFDISIPTYGSTPFTIGELVVNNDPKGWNGYRFIVDNYWFLNKNFHNRIAISSGYSEISIISRFNSDDIDYNSIKIFSKQSNNFIKEMKAWIEGIQVLNLNSSHSHEASKIKLSDLKSKDKIISKIADCELIWIDDEYIPPRIIESLYDNGIHVCYFNSITQFIHDYNQLILWGKVENILENKIIIMDVVLQDDSGCLSGIRDGERTGVALTREILKLNSKQKIIGCSSWCNEETKKWFWEHCNGFLEKDSDNLVDNIVKRFNEIRLNKRLPKTFIVHGWDLELRDELKNYLMNELHFPEPVILGETSSVGKTIIEKIEEATIGVDLVFILCTPDDTVISNWGSYKQARPNVLIELGYFYGRLGRLSGKVIVIKKGDISIPTDIAGVTYIQIDKSISEVQKTIIAELKSLRLINNEFIHKETENNYNPRDYCYHDNYYKNSKDG